MDAQGFKLLFLSFVICSSLLAVTDSLSQVEYMAANLDIRYKVVDNLKSRATMEAELKLTNKGKESITGGNWAVYFCHIRLIVVTEAMKRQPIMFSHINGCLHKFYPSSDFEDLAAGSTLTLNITAQLWEVARTDIMPNWYVTSPGAKAKVIESTRGESLDFVDDFVTKEQWKRFKADRYDPYSAEKRYNIVKIDSVADNDLPLVIPQPLDVSLDKTSSVKIDDQWKIYADKGLEKESKFLSDEFKAAVVTSSPSQSRNIVRVSLGDPGVKADGVYLDDAYSLSIDVSTQKINLIGKSRSGVFHGIQTLLALADTQKYVPMVTIKDAPRYGYRGMHLDVGRNFMPKSAVLRLLDVMAMYKLNKFHFHLTDDEGWRLEIPGLPELTEVGSKRCYDPTGDKCLIDQLGSGPDAPASATHYSVADYQEILQYANDRHIEVIPEFDMPGHGYAAIKSMEARFRKLNSSGDAAGASKYLLAEAGDPSSYLSIQMFKDDAINPCLESTYTFVGHIVKEVVGMHSGKQPLKVFHFGGDEVAHGAWKKSSACRNLAQQRGLNFSDSHIVDKLKDYFVQRVANITVKYNLSLAGWEDGLLGKGDVPYNRSFIANTDVFAYAWNNIWEWGGGKRAYELANAGYKVVMTQATNLYFDHPYEPDPEERGYYWATRFTDTRKTFGFMPDDLFANVETTLSGAPYSREELCKTAGMCVDLKQKQNIVGMAGAVWTETVRTADQLDSMIYPRLLALAERAWHKASWEDLEDEGERKSKRMKDWEKFVTALGKRELERLDKLKVKYYIPPPGARVDSNKLDVRTSIPNLPVQYSEDDGKTWRDVTNGTKVEKNIKLQTLSKDRTRASRQAEVKVKVNPTTASVNPPASSKSAHVNVSSLTIGLLQVIAVFKLAYKILP